MRGVLVGTDKHYVFDYDEKRKELVVLHSNVRNSISKELFHCLANKKNKGLSVEVMTKSQVNKVVKLAEKAAA